MQEFKHFLQGLSSLYNTKSQKKYIFHLQPLFCLHLFHGDFTWFNFVLFMTQNTLVSSITTDILLGLVFC